MRNQIVSKGSRWNIVRGKGASVSRPWLILDYSGDCWCPWYNLSYTQNKLYNKPLNKNVFFIPSKTFRNQSECWRGKSVFFFFIKRARVQVHSQWHDVELWSTWCQIYEKGAWRRLATYQLFYSFFLVILVYLLASGLRYYSVSHKINGIKPHNKMSLETSVPMSHKTGFIFTFRINNMDIPQKKNLPILQKVSPKMIPTALS